MNDMPEEIYADAFNGWFESNVLDSDPIGFKRVRYVRSDLIDDTAAARATGRCLILEKQRDDAIEALDTVVMNNDGLHMVSIAAARKVLENF